QPCDGITPSSGADLGRRVGVEDRLHLGGGHPGDARQGEVDAAGAVGTDEVPVVVVRVLHRSRGAVAEAGGQSRCPEVARLDDMRVGGDQHETIPPSPSTIPPSIGHRKSYQQVASVASTLLPWHRLLVLGSKTGGDSLIEPVAEARIQMRLKACSKAVVHGRRVTREWFLGLGKNPACLV